MMPGIARLYRYPVKGLTPEPCERLTVLDSGAVLGDRVLGLLFADAGPPVRGDWCPKERFVVLMNTPGLARLALRYDEAAARLTVALDGEVLAEAGLDGPGRARIASAVADYVQTLDESPLRDRPERLPLRLVGDPATPTFADRTSRHISIIGTASVEALAGALGEAVDERRFRANVMLDGTEPWEELGWAGRTLRIGGVEFEVGQPMVRCLATHANPETGERDLLVMNTLTSVFGHEKPLMGVVASPRGGGGKIAVGDTVEIVE